MGIIPYEFYLVRVRCNLVIVLSGDPSARMENSNQSI